MPPPEKKCKRHSATVFICAEVLLNVFRCLGHAELGLKIALISCRFNALVDKHFGDSRKWTLGWLEIRSSEDGTDAAELFKKNEYGNFDQLPFPQRASPDNIIGFERIFINHVDDTVIAFLHHIQHILETDFTLVLTISNQIQSWRAMAHDIWPMLNTNSISGLRFGYTSLSPLRYYISPTVLHDCAGLRSIDSFKLLPGTTAEDSDEAMDQSALSKWLHTPRADGRPKLLQCFVLAEQMLAVKLDQLKQKFLFASSSVSFIIRMRTIPMHFDDDIRFALFLNERTREQLTFGCVDNNQCLVKRSPIDRDEKQWAKWEQEASEAWNRNNVIGIMI